MTSTPRRWVAPPGWPVPPDGWTPPAGWTPNPSWPPAPPDWRFWTEVPVAPPLESASITSTSASHESGFTRELWVALGATAAIALGTLFPWVTVTIFSANGTQTGDGKIVLVLALLAGAAFMASRGNRGYIVGGVLVALCLADTTYEAIHVMTTHENVFGTRIGASPGAGLWIDVIASAVALVAVVKHRNATHR